MRLWWFFRCPGRSREADQKECAFGLKVVLWQNIAGHHQSSWIRAFAALSDDTVQWVVKETLAKERAELGWPVPETGKVQVIVDPTDEQIQRVVDESGAESQHFIASDMYIEPHIRKAFDIARGAKRRLALTSENRDSRGWQGLARRIRYGLLARQHGRRFDFVLVFGYSGEFGGRNFFKGCGFPDAKLFPSGYLVERPTEIVEAKPHDVFDIFFMGQLIRRKGLDTLLLALAQLKDLPWKLTVIGDGSESHALYDLSTQLGFRDDRVEWKGVLPNSEAMALVTSGDLLVLPSRFDGWGAVVNEALMRGVPVLCSDRCGARDLLLDEWRGGVARSEDHEDFAGKLRTRITQGPIDAAARKRVRDWSECITGEAGARYVEQILKHVRSGGPRPTAPWMTSQPDRSKALG
jgi:glycosyltransferase involved in cell wall biosynthesis